MRVLCLCLALAAPAQAEVSFNRDSHTREDLAVISTCFDAAQTWEAAQDCVNLTFERCIERIGKSASHADEGGMHVSGA
jgi:endonuclease IV